MWASQCVEEWSTERSSELSNFNDAVGKEGTCRVVQADNPLHTHIPTIGLTIYIICTIHIAWIIDCNRASRTDSRLHVYGLCHPPVKNRESVWQKDSIRCFCIQTVWIIGEHRVITLTIVVVSKIFRKIPGEAPYSRALEQQLADDELVGGKDNPLNPSTSPSQRSAEYLAFLIRFFRIPGFPQKYCLLCRYWCLPRSRPSFLGKGKRKLCLSRKVCGVCALEGGTM